MAGPKAILIVEDSPVVRLIIEAALTGYWLVQAVSIESAKGALAKTDVSMIILDIELPDGDGIQYFSLLRSDPRFRSVPVIFLTAKTDIAHKLTAFSLGAEDFITKPFEAAELRARVEARLRRAKESEEASDSFQVGDLVLSRSQQKVWINKDGALKAVSLTSLEFRLLALLLKKLDRIYNRDTLIAEVWGHDTHIVDRTVDTHVSHLRKKISSSVIRIEAVPGEGYRAVKGEG